jgi:hypothetical protein
MRNSIYNSVQAHECEQRQVQVRSTGSGNASAQQPFACPCRTRNTTVCTCSRLLTNSVLSCTASRTCQCKLFAHSQHSCWYKDERSNHSTAWQCATNSSSVITWFFMDCSSMNLDSVMTDALCIEDSDAFGGAEVAMVMDLLLQLLLGERTTALLARVTDGMNASLRRAMSKHDHLTMSDEQVFFLCCKQCAVHRQRYCVQIASALCIGRGRQGCRLHAHCASCKQRELLVRENVMQKCGCCASVKLTLWWLRQRTQRQRR